MSDSDMHIFDRTTGDYVAFRKFYGIDIQKTVFSPDGASYAVVTGGWDSKTRSIVRVHETMSGKTLFAFPAPSRWIKDVKFSPDGGRLALVGDAGEIEVWNISLVRGDK